MSKKDVQLDSNGFKKFGFEILEEHNKDNWYAFVCRKGK